MTGLYSHTVIPKWCSASGKVNGKLFGFNLDYGFGTESSKSMIFYDGKGHHLDKIKYEMNWKKVLNPIEIVSTNDDRVNLLFTPTWGTIEGVSLGILGMKGALSYGFFTGTMRLDNGEIITIKDSDRLFGWAEDFFQKW